MGEDHLHIAHSEIQRLIEEIEALQDELKQYKRLVQNVYVSLPLPKDTWQVWLLKFMNNSSQN